MLQKHNIGRTVKSIFVISAFLMVFISTSRGAPRHKLVEASETFRLSSHPVIFTRSDQALEFRVVEVGLDVVVGYYKNGESKTFDRDEISIIQEIKLDHVPLALMGALMFGALGYITTPDEEDPLAIPELWGTLFGVLGAGVGYTAAITTSGLYTYYFDGGALFKICT